MQIFLSATTDSLQVITGQAGSVDVHASYGETDQGTPPVLQKLDRQNTAITTATTTTVLSAPAASRTRGLKAMTIRNKHATNAMDVTVIFNQNSTLFEMHKVTLAAGEMLQYIDNIGFFKIQNVAGNGDLFRILSADDAGGQNVLTAQPWFPTSGAVAVAGTTTYLMDALLLISRAAGAVSHTTGILFGGTATLTSIQYQADVNTGDVDATSADSRTISRVATNTAVKAASVSTTEQISIRLVGAVRINVAGTFIPQFIYSAAPGGAPTIKANSYFRMTPIGDNNVVSKGVWT